MICEIGIPMSSPAPKHLSNFTMNSLCESRVILCFLSAFLGWNTEALGRRMLAVPLEQVAARKEISTVVTEVDSERVPLRGFTLALKLVPCVQSSIAADSVLNLPPPHGPSWFA
jgi:hypothetical protein